MSSKPHVEAVGIAATSESSGWSVEQDVHSGSGSPPPEMSTLLLTVLLVASKFTVAVYSTM